MFVLVLLTFCWFGLIAYGRGKKWVLIDAGCEEKRQRRELHEDIQAIS